MRPGHFWVCELGNAGDLLANFGQQGSPILAGPFASRQHWPPNEGEAGWREAYRGIPRLRYDPGECAILLRCYYHRTADDPEGLTFLRWKAARGEILVINTSELRAVESHQANNFKLTPPKPPPQLRQQAARANKKQRSNEVEPPFDPKMRWRLAHGLDLSTRVVCKDT